MCLMKSHTFQRSPFAQGKPLQAAVCFGQAKKNAVRVLSGSTEQQRGRRQLRVTLVLYTHWHLHLSLREEEVEKEKQKTD